MQVLHLGLKPYAEVEAAMRAFTAARDAHTPDQLWMLQHEAVFTQGVAGRDEHVLDAGGIPIVRTNRGGQVTHHGPGQVVAYPLLDLRRSGYFVKEYVYRLERSVLDTLAHFWVTGHRVRGEPGVYVRLDDPFGHSRLPAQDASGISRFNGLGKIAALGVKVSGHCTLHGAAFNVAMDLEPFARINPCGHAGLKTVDLASLGVDVAPEEVAQVWAGHLVRALGGDDPPGA